MMTGEPDVGKEAGMKVKLIAPVLAAMTMAGLAQSADPSSAADLIRAMYQRYAGKWYTNFSLTQKVRVFKDGRLDREEIWTEIIQLPGRVRSNIGDPAAGNVEIYVTDTNYVFRNHALVRQAKVVHTVLLFGFDVYCQAPEKTITRAQDAQIDLGLIHETTWQGRPVYVGGARKGDLSSNQFWIDKQHLYCVRLIRRLGPSILEVELNKYERLGGGWIATELVFKRDGQPSTTEEYLSYQILDRIAPETFSVRELK
jgi:hypothetical protein